VKVEVRAVGLKAMREKKGLTQCKLRPGARHFPELHPRHRGWRPPRRPQAPAADGEVLRLSLRGFVRGRPSGRWNRAGAGAPAGRL